MKKGVITALLAAAVLTGCAGVVFGTDRPLEAIALEESTENTIVLNTVSMFGGTDANTGVYQSLIAEFTEANPGITVKDRSATADNEWKASVIADFAVGNEPDVLQFFTEAQADQLIAMDKLVTLDEIIEAYPEYAKDTLPEALEMVRNRDGIRRAVPTTGFTEVLYCNKDIFDKYDIPLPTDWEQFKNSIISLRSHGIIPVAVSLNSIPHYWIDAFILYSAGMESYQEVPEEVPEDWVKGLELFRSLREIGAFPSGTDTIDNDYATQMFINKDAAMMYVGTWINGRIEDKENTIALPFPGVADQKAPAGALPAGFTSGFYITRSAWENPAKREAAVKFVMAQTSREAVTRYWEASGMVCRTATEVEVRGELTPLAESIIECEKLAGDNYVMPIDARMDAGAHNLLVKNIVGISTGQADAGEVLNEVLAIQASRNESRGNVNVQSDDY